VRTGNSGRVSFAFAVNGNSEGFVSSRAAEKSGINESRSRRVNFCDESITAFRSRTYNAGRGWERLY
jgi:hypothetical protein